MTPRVRQYVAEAAAAFDVSADAVTGRNRNPAACEARQTVMAALRCDGFSATQIGRWMQRDHTTVLHALSARG